MSLNYEPQTTPPHEYARIFERERAQAYPMVDAFEARMGAALERDRLEDAARVLACPFKATAPNWQHGRVIFARTVNYLRTYHASVAMPNLVDIGTAKGFSALCLAWALEAVGDTFGRVTSVDVLPPGARVRRNTIAEVDGLRTLPEILAPWASTVDRIRFVHATGIEYLRQHPERVHVAFVDGKHTHEAVRTEGELLAVRQVTGDVVIFDDLQVPGVAAAVQALAPRYDVEPLPVLPARIYGIGVRR